MTIENGNICFDGSSCVPWAIFLIYLAPAVLILAMALGVLLWDARRTPTPSQAASRANRHASLASAVGVTVMVVVLTWIFGGFALGVISGDGRVLATLPALAGASLLAAQAVGQLTWPRPNGAQREAELARRTVADVTPVWPRRLVFVWAGAAIALLVVFGFVAGGPRTLTREAGRYSAAIGPYPGWYYGLPMCLAILALVAATELVLRLITLRPAVAGVTTEWDLRLRRRSAGHLTRGVQLVLAATTAGVLVAAGWVHLDLGRDWIELASGGYASAGSPAQQYLGVGLLVTAVCVLLTGLASTALSLRRGRQNTRDPLGLAVPS